MSPEKRTGMFTMSKEQARKLKPVSPERLSALNEARKPKKETKEILTTTEQAREIMGKEFFGPDHLKDNWNIEIQPNQIPEIPFSTEHLEKAEERNEFLILRTDKAPDGSPLSAEKMNELMADKYEDAGGGKLLYSIDWYKDESFYKTETPTLSWALVSKEVIPNTKNKNYIQQTEELIKHFKNKIFEGQDIPPEYDEAIKELDVKKSKIEPLMDKDNATYDLKKATEMLAELKISKLTRHSFSEAFFDIISYRIQNKEGVLKNEYTWTNSRYSDGSLVDVGGAGSDGVSVYGYFPGSLYSDLGGSISRGV